jgi:hypothetical protein
MGIKHMIYCRRKNLKLISKSLAYYFNFVYNNIVGDLYFAGREILVDDE